MDSYPHGSGPINNNNNNNNKLYLHDYNSITVPHCFFYKKLFYRNVEAEIDPDFKNILRTCPS